MVWCSTVTWARWRRRWPPWRLRSVRRRRWRAGSPSRTAWWRGRGSSTWEGLGETIRGLSSRTPSWTSSSTPRDGATGGSPSVTRKFYRVFCSPATTSRHQKSYSLFCHVVLILTRHGSVKRIALFYLCFGSYGVVCLCGSRRVFYGEYKCSGPGANTTGRVAWARMLSDEEAQPFIGTYYIDGDSWLLGRWNQNSHAMFTKGPYLWISVFLPSSAEEDGMNNVPFSMGLGIEMLW